MRSRWLATLTALLALILVVGLIPTGTTEAARNTGLNWSIRCDSFINIEGSVALDRDNTGAGREMLNITATDALGNVLFSADESFIVGGSLIYPVGAKFDYAFAPQANPIRVQLTSVAGNGLPSQVVYATLGSCSTLGTVPQDEFTLIDFLDGRTSPTAPINTVPPGGANDPAVIAQQVGYLVVDTGFLNIRSGDSIQYTVVGRVAEGTELIVLGRNETRSWFYVQAGDVIGWVRSELTYVRGDLTTAPVVPVVGEFIQPRLFTFTTNPVRTIPVEGAVVVCDVPGQREYFIIGRTANITWYQVEVDCNGVTTTGWIRADRGAVRNPGGFFIPVTG